MERRTWCGAAHSTIRATLHGVRFATSFIPWNPTPMVFVLLSRPVSFSLSPLKLCTLLIGDREKNSEMDRIQLLDNLDKKFSDNDLSPGLYAEYRLRKSAVKARQTEGAALRATGAIF